jgi:hypothetical protein
MGTFDDEDFRAEKERIAAEGAQITQNEKRIRKMEVERLEQTYQFLERAKRASATYELANPDERRDLVREVFLELTVHNKEVAS